MTPKEKAELIEKKITNLNSSVLGCKKWKLKYVNRGANNYCMTICLNNKELFNGKFDTYGSVLSLLELLEFMFSKALDELDKKEKK